MKKTIQKHSHVKLLRDIILIVGSITATVLIVRLGIFDRFVSVSEEMKYIGSFVSGMFFTSLFTIAPAAVALSKISETAAPLTVALWGGLGAMVGDLIIFLFIRDSLSNDVVELIKKPQYKKLISLFKLRIFRWLIPLFGALVIISPLPDELGLAMMGFSKVPTIVMVPLTFILNVIGILLITSLLVNI